MSHRAVFLDRDGVLNRAIVRNGKPYPPGSESEMELIDGVPESLARLRAAGFRLVVVTNQPDVARGTQRREVVEAMHAALLRALALDVVKVCYHDDPDACACRKPAPGMLLEAAREMDIDLARSYMVGDRWRDVEAGRRAGVTAIFIDGGYAEQRPADAAATVGSLREATEWILARERAQ